MIKTGTAFSGLGSFEQAFKNIDEKHVIKFASEINKHSRSSYINNHIAENHYDNWFETRYSDLPDVDIFMASIPSSIPGNGSSQTFDDVRSIAFHGLYLYLKQKKPPFFIIEDLPKLQKHGNRKQFNEITNILSDTINSQMKLFPDENNLNYSLFHVTLNANQFGLPHNRERLYVIGVNGNSKINLPTGFPLDKKLKDIMEDDVKAAYFLDDESIVTIRKKIEELYDTGDISHLLLDELIGYTGKLPQRERFYRTDGCSTTLSNTFDNKGFSKGYRTGLYIVRNRLRRLTPLECFRLMGFHDSFRRPATDLQCYKQVGSSTPVPIMEAIIKSILEAM